MQCTHWMCGLVWCAPEPEGSSLFFEKIVRTGFLRQKIVLHNIDNIAVKMLPCVVENR